MKTLDEMATDWANQRCPEQGPEFIVWCMCREDFLEGAKAATELLTKDYDTYIKPMLDYFKKGPNLK